MERSVSIDLNRLRIDTLEGVKNDNDIELSIEGISSGLIKHLERVILNHAFNELFGCSREEAIEEIRETCKNYVAERTAEMAAIQMEMSGQTRINEDEIIEELFERVEEILNKTFKK